MPLENSSHAADDQPILARNAQSQVCDKLLGAPIPMLVPSAKNPVDHFLGKLASLIVRSPGSILEALKPLLPEPMKPLVAGLPAHLKRPAQGLERDGSLQGGHHEPFALLYHVGLHPAHGEPSYSLGGSSPQRPECHPCDESVVSPMWWSLGTGDRGPGTGDGPRTGDRVLVKISRAWIVSGPRGGWSTSRTTRTRPRASCAKRIARSATSGRSSSNGANRASPSSTGFPTRTAIS